VTYSVTVTNTGDLPVTMDVSDSFADSTYFTDLTYMSVTGTDVTWNNNKPGTATTVAPNITIGCNSTHDNKAVITITAVVASATPESLSNAAADDGKGYENTAVTTNVVSKVTESNGTTVTYPLEDKKDTANTPVQVTSVTPGNGGSSTASGSNASSSGSSGSDSAPNSSTGENTSGTWSKETVSGGTKWQFKKTDGTVAKDTWIKTGDKWYHFDNNGYAQTGWVQDQGKWYHCDPNSCAMDTGLYHDNTDSHDYYMNTDGSMATGWVTINGKQYYFNPNPVAATYTYDPVTQTWIWNGVNALPYGAMLKNTSTPDGHQVDETGARID
jgi:glucan-binding YG repeat protein